MRRGRITKPSWRPLGWPYEPAHPRHGATPVPPTAHDWQCATSCHSRDVSYCPAAGHGGWRTITISFHPNVSEMPAPQVGAKHLYYTSDQGVTIPRQEEEETVDTEDIPKEYPHHKQKEGRLVVKAPKEPHQEAFSKELEDKKVARWVNGPTLSRRGHMTSPPLLENGHFH